MYYGLGLPLQVWRHNFDKSSLNIDIYLYLRFQQITSLQVRSLDADGVEDQEQRKRQRKDTQEKKKVGVVRLDRLRSKSNVINLG